MVLLVNPNGRKENQEDILIRMSFLHSQGSLVQESVHGGGHCQRAPDHGTHARQETREGLGTGFTVDDFHRGDVVVEEHAGNAALRVDTLLVALGGVVAADQRPLVRSHGVLVRLETASRAMGGTVEAERGSLVALVDAARALGIPTQGQVGCRDHFHEIHVVVGRFGGRLLRSVQGVGVVMVRPLPALRDLVRQLRTESKLMDAVSHRMLVIRSQAGVQVRIQIVSVNVSAGEAAAGSDVEIADHLVHSDDTLNPAALPALGINAFRVALSLTLLDVLSLSECPLPRRVRFSNFVTGVTTARFNGILRRGSTSTFTTVVRVQMNGDFILRMPGWIHEGLSSRS
jgi:hypothetical protein